MNAREFSLTLPRSDFLLALRNIKDASNRRVIVEIIAVDDDVAGGRKEFIVV